MGDYTILRAAVCIYNAVATTATQMALSSEDDMPNFLACRELDPSKPKCLEAQSPLPWIVASAPNHLPGMGFLFPPRLNNLVRTLASRVPVLFFIMQNTGILIYCEMWCTCQNTNSKLIDKERHLVSSKQGCQLSQQSAKGHHKVHPGQINPWTLNYKECDSVRSLKSPGIKNPWHCGLTRICSHGQGGSRRGL